MIYKKQTLIFGMIILTLSSLFSAKVSKIKKPKPKDGIAFSLYISAPGGNCIILNDINFNTHFITASATSGRAMIRSTGGTYRKIYYTNTCSESAVTRAVVDFH